MTDVQLIAGLTALCAILAVLWIRASFIAAVRGGRIKRMQRELD
jgi:hypothetical protein